MPTFVLCLPDSPRVNRWFSRLNDGLREASVTAFFFNGGTKRLSKGEYLLSINPVMPLAVKNYLLGIPFFLSIVSYVMFPTSILLYAMLFLAFVFIISSLFYYTVLYQLIVTIQVSRMNKRLCKITNGTELFLRKRFI